MVKHRRLLRRPRPSRNPRHAMTDLRYVGPVVQGRATRHWARAHRDPDPEVTPGSHGAQQNSHLDVTWRYIVCVNVRQGPSLKWTGSLAESAELELHQATRVSAGLCQGGLTAEPDTVKHARCWRAGDNWVSWGMGQDQAWVPIGPGSGVYAFSRLTRRRVGRRRPPPERNSHVCRRRSNLRPMRRYGLVFRRRRHT